MDKSLEILKKHIELINGSLTKEDFVNSFEQVMQLVLRIEKRNTEAVGTMKQTYRNAMNNMRGVTDKDIADMKKLATDYCQKEMARIEKEHAKKMEMCDKKMSEMKDGMDADEEAMTQEIISVVTPQITQNVKDIVEKDLPQLGKATRDGLELLPENEKLMIDAIKGLRKELDELKRVASAKGTAGRSNNSMKFYDLSSQTNGTLKIFSVPKGLAGVVIGSDFPTVLMEGNGFTLNATRTQLTLTTVNAPSSGSQLLYQYVSIFN